MRTDLSADSIGGEAVAGPWASGLSTNRIEAFSDGVFAIAITLLVLNVHLPLGRNGELLSEAALLAALGAQWLTYLSYLLSVVVVGIYWVAHHGLFNYIRLADCPLFWLNILFLAVVAFIPFPTALLSQYGRYPSVMAIYGAVLVAAGLLLDAMRAYATRQRRLVAPDLSEDVVRTARRRNLTGPALYALAVAVALTRLPGAVAISLAISLAIYLLVPLYYILPGRIDRHWTTRDARAAAAKPADADASGTRQ